MSAGSQACPHAHLYYIVEDGNNWSSDNGAVIYRTRTYPVEQNNMHMIIQGAESMAGTSSKNPPESDYFKMILTQTAAWMLQTAGSTNASQAE
jgi:hypothetical protein